MALYSWGRNSFSPHLPSDCSGVNEVCHMELAAHSLCAVQVRFKSVSNEGHFTREPETVFRPHLPSHWSGITEICRIALPVHELRAVEVRKYYFDCQVECPSLLNDFNHTFVVCSACEICSRCYVSVTLLEWKARYRWKTTTATK
jgi:hypothetical protein